MGNSNNKSVLVPKEDIASSKLKETKEISNSQVCVSIVFLFFSIFFLRHCFFSDVFQLFINFRFLLGVEYLMGVF